MRKVPDSSSGFSTVVILPAIYEYSAHILLYMQRLRQIINEAVQSALLLERIQSSRLKRFFDEHGGVVNTDEAGRLNNDYLGDATDDDICAMVECDSWGQANMVRKEYRKRFIDGLDMTYRAKDGTWLYVVYKKHVRANPTYTNVYRSDKRYKRDQNIPIPRDEYYYSHGQKPSKETRPINTSKEYQAKAKMARELPDSYKDSLYRSIRSDIQKRKEWPEWRKAYPGVSREPEPNKRFND